MFDSAILVLLYNKELMESSTVTSLISSDLQFSNARLVLWNNGPESLGDTDFLVFQQLGYDVQVMETLYNESLAVIYNSFIRNNKAKKYIFLDDDSNLNSEYIKFADISSQNKVAMPIITTSGRVENPKVNSVAYSFGQKIDSNDRVTTIGSGLVVGDGVIISLLKEFGAVFDERFYFYGVDTSFCFRLNLNNLNDAIEFIHGFEHSLSRLKVEDPSFTGFRVLEHSYSLGLMVRYYHSFPKNVLIVVKVFLNAFFQVVFKKKGLYKITPFIKAVIAGKHYRAFD
ncbi:hypothetical protein ACSLBF_14940 [Pseudoalteromonas sp. T1lg65]|uniref:hypothetical protein n=1 Tax=Pseudoalteromonas sp. T1lg65 TaxID=2077101 RepID=UPI003F78BDED